MDGATFEASMLLLLCTLRTAWQAPDGTSLRSWICCELRSDFSRVDRRRHRSASHRAVVIPRSQHCPISAAFSIRHSTAPIARLKSDFTANT